MSKDLLDVKKDSIKSNLKTIIIISLIGILGVVIITLSFWISYNNRLEKQNEKLGNENKEEFVIKEKEIDEPDEEEFEEEIFEEEIEERKLPEWTNTAVQDIKDIYGSDEKQIYLTFDDGPSPEVTPMILDILKEEEVPATFFVLGKCVELYPELVKREFDEGHFIANHGYTHTYSKIYSSVENVYDEYLRANEAIQKAIEEPEYNSHLFRFPGGSSGGPYDSLKASAKQYLIEHEIANTNWNCLSSDAAGKTTSEAQYNEVLDTQAGKNSLIILMHDAADKKATISTVEMVIKHYKKLGYEFKNFYGIFDKDNQIVQDTEEELEKNTEDEVLETN